MICVFANKYAEANALKKPLFYNCCVGVQKRDVSILWTIILLAITVTHLPRVQLYWTTAALFHRTWARAFIVSKKTSLMNIDERMVRNKGPYTFRQYIKDKPTKWV